MVRELSGCGCICACASEKQPQAKREMIKFFIGAMFNLPGVRKNNAIPVPHPASMTGENFTVLNKLMQIQLFKIFVQPLPILKGHNINKPLSQVIHLHFYIIA